MEGYNLLEEGNPAAVEDSQEPEEDIQAAEADSLEPEVDSNPAAEDTLAVVEDNLEPEEDSQEDNPVAAEGNRAVEEDNNPAVAEGSQAAEEDNTLAVVEERRQQACRIWDNKWPPDLTGWHNLDTLKLAECRTHYKTVDRGRCWHRTWDI